MEINGFEIIQVEERTFSNKFGKAIKEDIIIAQKISIITEFPKNAKKVAKAHLQKALLQSEGEIKQDIENVIFDLDKIQPSPLFNSSTILNQR